MRARRAACKWALLALLKTETLGLASSWDKGLVGLVETCENGSVDDLLSVCALFRLKKE